MQAFNSTKAEWYREPRCDKTAAYEVWGRVGLPMKIVTQTTGNRREHTEWHTAIITIILLHDNYCLLNPTLYNEIKKYILFTEHEHQPSGITQEKIYRGTLRGYLSHMVKDGILKKDSYWNKRWYSAVNAEEWSYLLDSDLLSLRISDPVRFSTLKYGHQNKFY